MKPSIFVKYAPIKKSPIETLEILLPLFSKYGMKVGNWYSTVDEDSDGEYYPHENTEDLKGEEDLKSRIIKNKSGEWNTCTELFSNETLYIGVYQNADPTQTHLYIRVNANTSKGELWDFIYREGFKEADQIRFFENVADALSSNYFGIWANETDFLPLETNFIKEPSLFFLAWKGQSLSEENIRKVLSPQDGEFVESPFGKHGYVVPKHLRSPQRFN